MGPGSTSICDGRPEGWCSYLCCILARSRVTGVVSAVATSRDDDRRHATSTESPISPFSSHARECIALCSCADSCFDFQLAEFKEVSNVSLEKLVHGLGEQADRRKFLQRMGASALVFAGGVMGFPRDAQALWSCSGFLPPCGSLYHYQCCCLAVAPSPQCSCQDTWCWGCCGTCVTGERWACCECYGQGCSYAYIYDYSCTRCQGPS